MQRFPIQKTLDQCLSICAFFFPFLEVTTYFGQKVFLSTDSLFLRQFYISNLSKLTVFYTQNVYVIFIFMVGVFLVCSRGTVPLSKYARFNIIQAILINIIYSCIGSIYTYLPIVLRESYIGIVLANFFYLGFILIVFYSALLIFYYKYPTIPVISEAAKLQVQN
jgi:hypothetical protein